MNMLKTCRDLATKHVALAATLLAVAGSAGTLTHDFALDDVPIVVENQSVHGFSHLGDAFVDSWWPTGGRGGETWRPLSQMSLAVDWGTGGGSPFTFHLTNVLLHALATALVVQLLLALRAPTLGALLGGVVFALQPVHSEAVANVVGRADVLATLLALAAALLFLRARPSVTRTLCIAALYLLALGAKESAVALPALLLVAGLLDAGSWRCAWAGVWRERSVWLGTATALVLYLALRAYFLTKPGMPSLDQAYTGVGAFLGPVPHRVFTAFAAFPVILQVLFAPRTLSVYWGPGVFDFATALEPRVLLGVGLLLALPLAAALLWRRSKLASLGLLWIPIAVLPFSNIFFPVGFWVAERLLYFASVGVAILVASLGAPLLAGRLDRNITATLLGLYVAFLGVTFVQRNHTWKDMDTVWATYEHDFPGARRTLKRLSTAAINAGDYHQGGLLLLQAYHMGVRVQDDGYQAVRLLMLSGETALASRVLNGELDAAAGPYDLFQAYLKQEAGSAQEALDLLDRAVASPMSRSDAVLLLQTKAHALEALGRTMEAEDVLRSGFSIYTDVERSYADREISRIEGVTS